MRQLIVLSSFAYSSSNAFGCFVQLEYSNSKKYKIFMFFSKNVKTMS
jgi:hypothetical protein